MVSIISRQQAGLIAPTSREFVTWAQREGVAWHHSDGSKYSTPRDLQEYAMEDLGYRDTHYNFFVDYKGNITEGRGWLVVGGHAKYANTAWIGCCFIGREGDVTPAALAAMRDFFDEAERRKGGPLQYKGHGSLPGNSTECPGAQIREWMAKGMPRGAGAVTEDDMFCAINETSGKVRVMQIDVMKLGGWVGPLNEDGSRKQHPSGDNFHWCDGQYGPNTARGLASVLGGGSNGERYGDWEYAALQEMLRKKDIADALAGLPAPELPTFPETVTITIPATTLTVPLTAS